MERPDRPEQHQRRPGTEGERPGKSLTRGEAHRLVLAALETLNATPAEVFRAVLAAYAESDFNPYAKHPTDDTWGLYQQNPKWWGTKEQILDPVYATTSFVAGRPNLPALRKITLTDDPVVDCWRVQKWGAPSPDTDLAGFRAHPSTANYTRRLGTIQELIDNPNYFDGDRDQEPQLVAVGGAQTSRGVVWLDDLPGANPAEKLRTAWGAGDRRAIIVAHSTTIDAGAQPIPVPAGVCLAGPAAPQTEFSDQGRVFVRATGGTAVFRSMDSGSNFSGTKGWSFVNIGFEGTSSLNLFAPNPMNASGPIIAYASIEGCSFDTFKTVIESPMLGVHFDIRYFNNVAGPYAFKLTGSDCQLWTHGGKGDWGGGNTDPKRRALIWLAGLEKSTIGSARAPEDTGGGLYLTCSGAAGLEIDGGSSRGGVDIFGMTIEGRNAGAPSAGAALRQTGNSVNFYGGNINYAMGNPAATGRGDRAFADISGGTIAFFGTKFRRGSPTAPFIARRGPGAVDTFGCREVPSGALVTATNL